jgi:metal-responsive CopG/Arc/MetJ family transcriptional regulator
VGRNAKESEWYSTPNAARNRKRFEMTLPEAALERLDKMADARGVSRSAVVESLIMAAPIREAKE